MVEEERESSCLGNGQVRITVQLQVCRQDAVAVFLERELPWKKKGQPPS